MQNIIAYAEMLLLVADPRQLGIDAEKFWQLQRRILSAAEDELDKEIAQRKDWPPELRQDARLRAECRAQHRAARGVKKKRGAK